MNLNTIVEVKRPAVVRGDRMARRPRLAGRRHLAVLRAAGRDRHAGRSRAARLAGADRDAAGPRDRRDLQDRRAARLQGSAGMAGGAAVRQVHRRVPDVLQDLERRDRRRQRLHVAAGRRHDLADRGARRRLHPVAARRQAAPGSGRRLRHRQPYQRAAEGRAAALDPPARVGAVQALCHAPGVAHPPRPLGGADHRARSATAATTSC